MEKNKLVTKGVETRMKRDMEKEVIYGKCKESAHISNDCRNNVFCVVCQRGSHRTEDCTILRQPKPVTKYVGYGAKGLECLLVQNTKQISVVEHANPMAIIQYTLGC